MWTGKALDDQILLGVVINGLQDNSVRDHIIRNTNRLTSYQLVRDELLEIARTSRVLSQMPSPMDIGALPQRGARGRLTKAKEKEVRVKMTKARQRQRQDQRHLQQYSS